MSAWTDSIKVVLAEELQANPGPLRPGEAAMIWATFEPILLYAENAITTDASMRVLIRAEEVQRIKTFLASGE